MSDANEPTAQPVDENNNNEPQQQQEEAPPAVVYPDAPADIAEKPNEVFTESAAIRIYAKVTRAVYAPVDHSEPGKDVTQYFVEQQAKGRQIFKEGSAALFEDSFFGKEKELRVWFDQASLDDDELDVFSLGRKPKSLFLCLVTVNPFDEVRQNSEKDDDGNIIELKAPHMPESLSGYEQTELHPRTNFYDDDFLKNKGLMGGKSAPNNFQKLIEMLLRIKKRGLTVLPPDCLVETSAAPAGQEWNFLDGHMLVEDKFFKSPDGDELYFKIHSDRKILLEFAEKQSLTLRTNPYSFGGGAGFIYSSELDEELRLSALGFINHFADTIPEDDEFCLGKRDKKTNEPHSWGFCVEVPQKMRLALRMLREGWAFGGAGLQLDEMKESGTFLLNYFPIHNKKYQEDYEIDRWCSLWTMFNPCRALADNELALIHYFGENVAIYFSWMRQYVMYLTFPLIIGFVAGVLQEADEYRNLSGMGFSILMILWGVAWIRKWQRAEHRFSLKWGQNVEAAQELVRDEFEYEDKKLVDVRSIYTLDFEYPLTMQRLPDGTMVELVFPSMKRTLRRYLISYPVMTLLCCGMAAALFFIESYRQRFENRQDQQVQIGASILSAITTIVFSKVAAILTDVFNDYENCRTDQEYEDELVLKSFAFNFIATYFAVVALLIWPGVPDDIRVSQLRAQMTTQQVAMPFVGNVLEILLPRIMTNLQRRTDTLGGIVPAICSYFCCCCSCECIACCNYADKKIDDPHTDREEQGIELWKQAQKGRYTTTSTDYLEVTLQYGYMMMFAAIFPWAGVAAFFNNLIEIRVDAYKLINEFQRPIARTTQGIGAWNDIFWILTGIAIVTNTYIITVISATPLEAKLAARKENRLEYFAYLQYFIAIAILILGVVRGTVSPSVKKAEVKANLLNDRAIQEFVKKQLSMSKEELASATLKAQDDIDKTDPDRNCCDDCFLC